jgi:hypothetical protein
VSYNGKLVLDGEAADGDIEIYADGRNYPAYEIAVVPDNDLTEHERDTNARRIVACWNACEGIPTEALQGVNLQEKFTAVDDILKRALLLADDYCSQRDELLAAISALVADYDAFRERQGLTGSPQNTMMLKARDAIARVKGGAA